MQKAVLNMVVRSVSQNRWVVWWMGLLATGYCWFGSGRDIWRYLFHLRVPILAGVVLCLLPYAALTGLRAMLRNLFVMRYRVHWQLPQIYMSATMVGLAITLIARIILENAWMRFNVAPLPPSTGMGYVVLVLLTIPTVITVATLSSEDLLTQRQAGKWWNTVLVFGSLLNASLLLVTYILQEKLLAGLPSADLWQYELTLLLAAPVCITATVLSIKETPYEFRKSYRQRLMKEVLVGLLGSFVLLSLTYAIRWAVIAFPISDPPLTRALSQLVKYVTNGNPAGYLDGNGQVMPIHLAGLGFFVLGFVVYGVLFLLFQPSAKRDRYEVPALLFVMIIIGNLTLLLGGMAFYLDDYRIPVGMLLLFISGFSYWFWQVDHYFKLLPANPSEKPKPKATIDAIKQRLSSQPEENRTLVVICASGGGIQAAGWTVQVLKGLQDLLGSDFTRAIGLISSVSGGSVGIMHYLDRFGPAGYPEHRDLEIAFKSATSDGLDAVGWGLAYPDLWRVLGMPFFSLVLTQPPLLQRQIMDRGDALELDWQGETRDPSKYKTLQTWERQIEAGQIPVPIFNATLVEDGRRFLISPMTFGESKERKVTDFNTLYSDFDLGIVTAARLSATFPYVSPICRNEGSNPNGDFHIADGGYFDNSGTVTVVEWLNQKLESLTREARIKNILLLQINAFPEGVEQRQEAAKGWFMETLGPLQAMYSVRDSTQISRTRTAIELLTKKWEDTVTIRHFPIFFPSSDEFNDMTGFRGANRWQFYNQQKGYAPPLSWKLTDREKQAIETAWRIVQGKPVFVNIQNTCIDWGITN